MGKQKGRARGGKEQQVCRGASWVGGRTLGEEAEWEWGLGEEQGRAQAGPHGEEAEQGQIGRWGPQSGCQCLPTTSRELQVLVPSLPKCKSHAPIVATPYLQLCLPGAFINHNSDHTKNHEI